MAADGLDGVVVEEGGGAVARTVEHAIVMAQLLNAVHSPPHQPATFGLDQVVEDGKGHGGVESKSRVAFAEPGKIKISHDDLCQACVMSWCVQIASWQPLEFVCLRVGQLFVAEDRPLPECGLRWSSGEFPVPKAIHGTEGDGADEVGELRAQRVGVVPQLAEEVERRLSPATAR